MQPTEMSMWYFHHYPRGGGGCVTVQCSSSCLDHMYKARNTILPLAFHSEQFSSISSLQICMIKVGFGRSNHPLRVQTFLAPESVCLSAFIRDMCDVLAHNTSNQVWPCKNNQNTFVPFKYCTVPLELHTTPTHMPLSCSSMQTDFGAILHFATVFVWKHPEKYNMNMI